MNELNFQDVSGIESEPIHSNQIHLWLMSLSVSVEKQSLLLPLLSDQQKQKLEKIKDPIKKTSYIAGRAYLQQLLRHYLDLMSENHESTELDFGEFGKPQLKHFPSLYFNFSDTCGIGLFAFSTSSQLGVDIESLSRQGRFEQIIKRRFSDDEQYLLEKDGEAFLKCWTRKEAFGKATGTGLNYPLRDFTLCENLEINDFIVPNRQYSGQQIFIKEQQQNFVAAVVAATKVPLSIKAFRLQV